eukprot:371165_1
MAFIIPKFSVLQKGTLVVHARTKNSSKNGLSLVLTKISSLRPTNAIIVDIEDDSEHVVEWSDIYLIQPLFDECRLSFNQPSDIKSDPGIFSLWNNSEDSYTSIYYQCKYLHHDLNTISVQFLDAKKTNQTQTHYYNSWCYRIPVVVRTVSAIQSHPLNQYLADKVRTTSIEQITLGLQSTSISQRKYNKCAPIDIVNSMDNQDTEITKIKPQVVRDEHTNRNILVFMPNVFCYNPLKVPVQLQWLLDNVMDAIVVDGSISFQMKQPKRYHNGVFCSMIEESPSFTAQYYYVPLAIEQGGSFTHHTHYGSTMNCTFY